MKINKYKTGFIVGLAIQLVPIVFVFYLILSIVINGVFLAIVGFGCLIIATTFLFAAGR